MKKQQHPHEHLAAKLKAWRSARSLPLKTVAADLQISTMTWNRWEHGMRFPLPAHIFRLSEYTAIPICHFFVNCAGACLACPRQKQRNSSFSP